MSKLSTSNFLCDFHPREEFFFQFLLGGCEESLLRERCFYCNKIHWKPPKEAAESG